MESANRMHEGDVMMETLRPEIEVNKLADGFGFGEGGISHAERRAVAGDETLQAVEDVINSSEILVPVDKDKNGNLIDDDGCGDGRSVKTVLEGDVLRAKSLNRAKVFGGSTAMGTGARIGLGEADATMHDTFHSTIETLKDKRIDFGAHTDDHQWPKEDSPKSGCGAIDMAPSVVANAVKYSDKIKGSIEALGADTTQLDEVFSNFEKLSKQIENEQFSGKEVVREIMKNGKIVKELQHDHYEAYVVLNTIEGQTVNQAKIREVAEDKAQVFGVDVWRMQALATRLYPGDTLKQNQAFLSELVYTLGVSATLTTGDLPVYVVSEKTE